MYTVTFRVATQVVPAAEVTAGGFHVRLYHWNGNVFMGIGQVDVERFCSRECASDYLSAQRYEYADVPDVDVRVLPRPNSSFRIITAEIASDAEEKEVPAECAMCGVSLSGSVSQGRSDE